MSFKSTFTLSKSSWSSFFLSSGNRLELGWVPAEDDMFFSDHFLIGILKRIVVEETIRCHTSFVLNMHMYHV